MCEPFALELHRRFVAGCQIEELAAQTGIPVERIAQRIRAADDYLDRGGRAETNKPQAA